jgi:hypothetical protein
MDGLVFVYVEWSVRGDVEAMGRGVPDCPLA